MSRTDEVTFKRIIEVEVEFDATLTVSEDDDGCGSATSSGNSMTGASGVTFEVEEIRHDEKKIMAAIEKAIEEDHAGLETEALEEAYKL